MKKAIPAILLSAVSFLVTAQSPTKLPFVGSKYFEDQANATTYTVTIKTNATVVVRSGGRGIENKGSLIYQGKYSEVMKGKYEGVKFENGALYLLDNKGKVRKDCLDDDMNECTCKFSIKTEVLTK